MEWMPEVIHSQLSFFDPQATSSTTSAIRGAAEWPPDVSSVDHLTSLDFYLI